MTIVIAGERSGVGKTTVTLAILAALLRYSNRVQSFKVGPDYIDPMFHRAVTGLNSYNLDPVMTSEKYVQDCFATHTQGMEYALIEGVMGLFDGVEPTWNNPKVLNPSFVEQDGFQPTNEPSDGKERETVYDYFASTAHIARLLDLPVVMVLDCSRLSGSIAAVVHGYTSLDPRLKFGGLILNQVGSDRHLELLQTALEPLHIPILGVIRRQSSITIPDRHLGLIPTAELSNLPVLIDHLGELGQTCFDWSLLLPLLSQSFPFPPPSHQITPPPRFPTTSIAIAHDPAFSFYYADNLEILTTMGAELIPWSPMDDPCLPSGIQGIYLGGGFPEVFARELSENLPGKQTLFSLIHQGVPTYAECGGLMYLTEHIIDFNDQPWSMVGILPTQTRMKKGLTLGYRQAIAQLNTPMITHGSLIQGHEFHRSQTDTIPSQPIFQFQNPNTGELTRGDGWSMANLHASYLHLHWGASPSIPHRFLQQCQTSKNQLK